MAKKDKEGADKKKTPLSVRLIYFLFMVVGVVFLPMTIVLAVCLIPSFVARLTDRHAEKTAWVTVGAMNLAGSFPALFELLGKGFEMDAVLPIISDSVLLMFAYGGAGVGWFLNNAISSTVASAIVRRSRRRLKEIDARQKDLVRKWGADVTL